MIPILGALSTEALSGAITEALSSATALVTAGFAIPALFLVVKVAKRALFSAK